MMQEGTHTKPRGRPLKFLNNSRNRGLASSNWRNDRTEHEQRNYGISQNQRIISGLASSNWRNDRTEHEQRNYGISQNDRKNQYLRKGKDDRTFPFKYVQNLLSKPLEEVMQKLSENNGFFEFIGKEISPDYIIIIVELLAKITEFEFSRTRVSNTQKMLSSGFLVNLKSYISNLPFQNLLEKRKNSFYWRDPDSFWNNLLKFCSVSLNENPHFFVDNLLKIVQISIVHIKELEKKHEVHICDKIKDELNSLSERAEKIEAKFVQIKLSGGKVITDDQEEEPTDDFHDISIFPSTDELLQTQKPFLRKNIISGSFRDVHHYLDIQFRLLREDFVGPLRQGIQAYISGKQFRDIQDIKIYPKVQFLNPIAATEHYCVLLRFHFSGKLSTFKFEDSRKFMFGSLICFTNDNFKNILFGRIVDRKIDYLKQGQLVVGFDKQEELTYNTDYVMVECGIYFEPYYHVLKVLKNIKEDNFPMKNYIVDVDKSVMTPQFASPSIVYNVKSHHQRMSWQLFNPNQRQVFFSDLNKSQNDAFVAALTRQFSIIQGPPGTGKTYVGLKVAKTLLKNSDVWCKNSPMLIICFTNHALDQFLEGLIGTTDNIIRIGGQSKNENLKSYNLKEHTKKIGRAVWRKRDEVTYYLREIKRVTDDLSSISNNTCILNFKMFVRVIPNFHESWLANATNADFLEWLLTESIPKYEEADLEKISLLKQFEKITIEDSDEDDEPEYEANEFASLLEHTEQSDREPLLDLKKLQQQIAFNTSYLENELKTQMVDNDEKVFEYITLKSRNDKLKAINEFVKQNLATAPNEIKEPSLINVKDSKYIPIRDRWNLYFHWVNLYKKALADNYEEYNEKYRQVYEEYIELRDIENIEVLKTMEVIGMTTTSAARLHSSLQILKCPIVIVEEAAEVLEAHIITSLTKSCQQLILIGDHQQLRPTTANYRIEKDFHLGISLFERMVRNDVQCFTLDTQHRMRPEISSLITPTIYPNLKDHESVLDRPPIKGIDKCLYFIDHTFAEEAAAGNSKKNIHEVKFLVQLARYLILNGYEPTQITILAAYLGQMFEMQREKKKIHLLQNVRISVLDNYQGEESDIILLSLVRNNENKIGFLSIDNRVCVALSRARNGLYIMGNMTLLCNQSQLWCKIRQTLLGQEAIGSFLTLKCQNHGKKTMVTTASDFSSVSEGGCDQICNSSLVCGHKCKMQCHTLDKDHEEYNCPEICNRKLCDSDPTHLCRKMCGEDCGPCNYPKNVTLDCGHGAVIDCYKNPEDCQCNVKINVTLPCGHDAVKPCYIDVNIFKCQVPCDARLDCGHCCIKKCHLFKDPDHIEYKCLKPCTKFRKGCTNLEDDEHRCSQLCYEECEPCRKLVRKKRTVCPHLYDVPCLEDVDNIECNKPCKKVLKCGHLCQNTCSEECTTLCKKKVKKQIPGCNHSIQLPCHQEADRRLCDGKCPRIMNCGHVCGGICKQPCDISKCKEIVDACILAKCGHIIKKVPCFVKTAYNIKGEASVKNLESYCTEPCTAILNCSSQDKHKCSGTCGKCYQGRIHVRCTMKCTRILICDHECSGLCRETCKPCTLKCSFKCKHSICKKPCGNQCTICKETCNRRCKHQRCTKKCGEVCNVPPCEEPCEKKLEKCGHPCIGFCNEPCPPLCRICDKKDVEELFFGTEDEEDARFILLKDCGHILENDGMKHWLSQEQEAIKFKVCPKCKTKIFTTERYSDYVKRAVEAISAAKIIGIGTSEKINEKYQELTKKLNLLTLGIRVATYGQCRKLLLSSKNALLDRLQKVNRRGRVQHLNLVDLNAIEIKSQLLERVFKIMKLPDVQYLSCNIEVVEQQIDLILSNLLREVDDITTTEIEDIQREINRLHKMIQILPLLYNLNSATNIMKLKIKELNDRINQLSKYEDQMDEAIKVLLDELRKKSSMLGITELEKQEIVKAIGLSKGHWYQCPNGHPYAIGECGGAMQTSRCPECNAQIGGQSHRLLQTNSLASYMDGAAHSAWSEYQNINNYQF